TGAVEAEVERRRLHALRRLRVGGEDDVVAPEPTLVGAIRGAAVVTIVPGGDREDLHDGVGDDHPPPCAMSIRLLVSVTPSSARSHPDGTVEPDGLTV